MDQEIPENLPELPSQPPREALIATAIKFLQNPKVANSSPEKKKTFLTGKGLTSEEIQIAFTRSGVESTVENGEMMVAVPQQTVSVWSRLKDFSMFAVVVGSVIYAFMHIYKTFIEPLFQKHTKEQEERLDCIETSINSVSSGIARDMLEIQTNLIEIRQHLEENSTKLNYLSSEGKGAISNYSSNTDSSSLHELKSELASIKGLLLSRRQFPATPSNPPVIPSWQQLKPAEPSEPTGDVVDTRLPNGKMSNDEESEKQVTIDSTNSEKTLNNGYHEIKSSEPPASSDNTLEESVSSDNN